MAVDAPEGGAATAADGTGRPLVTVVIPARNAAATIARAVRSVLAQDWRPLEVIVVDDASADATAAVVEGLAAEAGDAALRLLRLAAAQGAAGARNAGIAAARGAMIAFQDADDEWLAGKLARQVALLLSDAHITFAACGARLVSPEGRDLGPLFGGRTPPAGREAWRALLAHNTIATPTVIVRQHELQALGGFDTSLRIAEDQDMWLRLAMRGCLGYVNEALVRVHVTPGSLSGVGSPRGYEEQLLITLPMVQRYVALKQGELSRREIRRILGERWGRIGRTAYSFGAYGEGLRMVAYAMALGYRPLENLLFLLSAAPPSRWLKRRLGIGGG